MWKRVTVKQYMDIKRIQAYPNQTARERIANLIHTVYGVPIDDLHDMSFNKFDQLARKVAFTSQEPSGRLRRVLWIRGTRYVLQDKIGDYNPAAGLSLIHYRNEGVYHNVHNVLAWIYKPTFGGYNPDKAAKYFLSVSVDKAAPAFFLFFKKALRLKRDINAYKAQEMEMLTQHLEVVTKHFQNTGDGIIR